MVEWINEADVLIVSIPLPLWDWCKCLIKFYLLLCFLCVFKTMR